MSKYIDVEKLLAEIRKRKYEWQAILDKNKNANSEVIRNIIYEDENTLDVIRSLQQEPPETDGDDGKFVKILVRKEFAEQFQRLGDEIQASQSPFVGAMNQQKQQEIDLEKEYKEYVENDPVFSILTNRNVGLAIARHFYSLGKNTRKEE